MRISGNHFPRPKKVYLDYVYLPQPVPAYVMESNDGANGEGFFDEPLKGDVRVNKSKDKAMSKKAIAARKRRAHAAMMKALRSSTEHSNEFVAMLKLDPSEPAGRNVQFAVNGTFYGVACEEPDDSEGDNPGPNPSVSQCAKPMRQLLHGLLRGLPEKVAGIGQEHGVAPSSDEEDDDFNKEAAPQPLMLTSQDDIRKYKALQLKQAGLVSRNEAVRATEVALRAASQRVPLKTSALMDNFASFATFDHFIREDVDESMWVPKRAAKIHFSANLNKATAIVNWLDAEVKKCCQPQYYQMSGACIWRGHMTKEQRAKVHKNANRLNIRLRRAAIEGTSQVKAVELSYHGSLPESTTGGEGSDLPAGSGSDGEAMDNGNPDDQEEEGEQGEQEDAEQGVILSPPSKRTRGQTRTSKARTDGTRRSPRKPQRQKKAKRK
jgi:hypothetical protein